MLQTDIPTSHDKVKNIIVYQIDSRMINEHCYGLEYKFNYLTTFVWIIPVDKISAELKDQLSRQETLAQAIGEVNIMYKYTAQALPYMFEDDVEFVTQIVTKH